MENLPLVGLGFSPKGQKSQTGACSRTGCSAAAGTRPATLQRQKASNLQKRKGLFSNLLLQFKWRVNRKQTRSPEEVCRHMHFCQEGSILEEGLRWWHVHNINVVSFFFFSKQTYRTACIGRPESTAAPGITEVAQTEL